MGLHAWKAGPGPVRSFLEAGRAGGSGGSVRLFQEAGRAGGPGTLP